MPIHRRPLRRHPERGASAVEFALVLPIFLAVVGTLAFGAWVGTARAIIEHGASEGVRYASIPSSADLRTYPSDPEVVAKVEEATPLLTPTSVQVLSMDAGIIRGAPVAVRVTYEVPNPAAPLLSALEAIGVMDPSPDAITLTAYARVRRE